MRKLSAWTMSMEHALNMVFHGRIQWNLLFPGLADKII